MDRQISDLEQPQRELKLQRVYAATMEEADQIQLALGRIHARLGEFNEAIPLLEAAARREPTTDIFCELRRFMSRFSRGLDWWLCWSGGPRMPARMTERNCCSTAPASSADKWANWKGFRGCSRSLGRIPR